ncbi:MAG TPA: hypothetical protein VNK04_09535 [Gemmataceae bacterium]|nr:hypothetical protein [Gemmataceae bacterium]
MARTLLIAFVLLSLALPEGRAQEKLFSGPQVGEKLPPFKVRGFFGDDAGKELDFVKQAAGRPIVLVFIHDVNRLALSFTRYLTAYTAGRAKDGLATGVILLSDNVTEGELQLKRWGHALTREAPVGISLDGREGPGSYGLNRNVTLTILVGKDGKVTANFALVQPSIQVDMPTILEEIAKVAGGPAATLEDLLIVPNPRLQGFLSLLVQKTSKPEDVDREAAAIEELVKRDEAARHQLGRVARRVVEGGRLATYGTPRAQEYFRRWAKEYGGAPK